MSITDFCTGQTEVRGDQPDLDLVGDSADGTSFLDRERAALGDDAARFATAEDADEDDLLGGGGDFDAAAPTADELGGFESSFPAIDTSNEVCAP